MKPDIIPLVIGISLCSASAVLLYIWYRTKDADDIKDSPSNSQHPSTKAAKVECIIPNNIVPLVVGRGEANVKSIEGKTNTQIRFKAKDEHSQICVISGNLEDVKKAAELVNIQASPPPNLTEEIIVPQSAYGKIIGRCGETLQEICRISQAKVHIDYGDRNDGETRRVLITGTRAHVNKAKLLIDEKVRIEEENQQLEVKREPRGNLKPVEEPTTPTTPPMVQPKREKLPSNSMEGQLEVYVSAVASPSRFWIQLYGKQSNELDILIESMTEYYDNPKNQKIHRIADPYLGQIVTAAFKFDSKWYRAEIVGILPNDYNPRKVVLDLYFVDFGDSEYVQPNEVFELRTDFLTLRFQAIECFLAHVKPKNKEEDKWDSHAVSRFESLTHVARWKKMNARIVTTKERKYGDPIKREGSPIPGVQLFNPDKPEINIADELIAEGLADGTMVQLNGNHGTENVLRLDGSDEQQNNGARDAKELANNHTVENDKLAELTRNSEKISQSAKNTSKSFIDVEKQNGNQVKAEIDNTVDSNLNRSYKVT